MLPLQEACVGSLRGGTKILCGAAKENQIIVIVKSLRKLETVKFEICVGGNVMTSF